MVKFVACPRGLTLTKEKTMEDWEGMESNCCGAEIVCMDVCSDCKEHCVPEDEDETDD